MVRTVGAYVESRVAMAYDDGAAAWAFDPDLWGVAGQGRDEAAALAALQAEVAAAAGPDVRLEVRERVAGDEQAFARDRAPATGEERALTLDRFTRVRQRTLDLVTGCTDAELDWDDAGRELPSFASWRTVRELAWHVSDTESRYYLPSLGLPARGRAPDLVAELQASASHVHEQVAAVPADLEVAARGEVWTTVKLLRRLAWHETGELVVMERLVARARRARG